jgi:hypothetical protein
MQFLVERLLANSWSIVVHDRGGPTTVEERADTYNFLFVHNYANDQSQHGCVWYNSSMCIIVKIQGKKEAWILGSPYLYVC